MGLIATLTRRSPATITIDKRISIGGGFAGTGFRFSANGLLPDQGISNSAIIHRCVNIIASNAASLDLAIERDGELDFEHPIARLWNRTPNPVWSARVLKEILWTKMELRGQAFFYLNRGETGFGEVREIWPIFDTVEIIVNNRENPLTPTLLGFRVLTQYGSINLLPEECLWLRYPSDESPWSVRAPLQSASFAAELDAYARSWQLNEYKNGANPAAVVFLGDVSEEVFNQTVASFNASATGPANAGKHIFLAGTSTVPTKYDRLGLTPAEMSYIDSRKQNAEEMILAFGVPRDLIFGQSTFDNQKAAKVYLWSDLLVPKTEIVAGEVDIHMLPDLNLSCRFDTSNVEALHENLDAVYNRVRSAVYADVMKLSEGRALLGLPDDPSMNLTQSAFRAQFKQQAMTTLSAVPMIEARAKAKPLSATAISRLFDRHEASMSRAVSRLAAKQRKMVLAKVQRSKAKNVETRISADDIFDLEYWREQTRDALNIPLSALFDDAAGQTASALNVDFNLLEPRVTALMEARLTVISTQVNDTTLEVLRSRLLSDAVEEGASITQMSSSIRSVFDDLESFRAERIARTEVVGGFNASSREAAVASDVVSNRVWRSTSDAKTRESHAELDGYETEGLDDPYPNGLMFPGDPSGDTAETVNCRCYEEFNIKEKAADE